MNDSHIKTKTLTGVALFTAIVVVLQLLGSFIRFGPFSISLVLIPIVVGAAMYGATAGAWLGFVFGVAVLLSGDAAVFMPINPIGTVVTVLAKGTLAGFCAGLVYRALEKKEPVCCRCCCGDCLSGGEHRRFPARLPVLLSGDRFRLGPVHGF